MFSLVSRKFLGMRNIRLYSVSIAILLSGFENLKKYSSASHHDFRSNAQPSTQILIGMYLWGSHPRPGEEEEKIVVAEKKNWCNFCSEFTMDPMWRILRRNFGYNAWNASFSHCVGHYGLPTKNHPTYYTYFWPPLPSLNTLAIKKTLWLKNEGTS